MHFNNNIHAAETIITHLDCESVFVNENRANFSAGWQQQSPRNKQNRSRRLKGTFGEISISTGLISRGAARSKFKIIKPELITSSETLEFPSIPQI